MNKLALCRIVVLFIIISCNSKNSENNNNTVDEIVEIEKEENPDNAETKGNEEFQVKLDAAFSQFLGKFEKVDLPYKIEPEETLDFDNISLDEQAEYLSKAEDLNKEELKQMEDYAKFFYISNPVRTKKFNAVVYGRSEMGSTYYLLCTFNNSGKLISSIDFAMHQLIGAGPQAGQEFIMTGEIDKNLKVTTTSDGKISNYLINEEGKIVKR